MKVTKIKVPRSDSDEQFTAFEVLTDDRNNKIVVFKQNKKYGAVNWEKLKAQIDQMI